MRSRARILVAQAEFRLILVPAAPNRAERVEERAGVVGLHCRHLAAQVVQEIRPDVLILPPRTLPRLVRRAVQQQPRILDRARREEERFSHDRVAFAARVHHPHACDPPPGAVEPDHRVPRQHGELFTLLILLRVHDREARDLEPPCEERFEVVAKARPLCRNAFPDCIVVLRLRLVPKVLVGHAIEGRDLLVVHRPRAAGQPVAPREVHRLKLHQLPAPKVCGAPQAPASRDLDTVVRDPDRVV